MVIGIVGYFTVPSVANYIVHAGGGYTLLYKSSNVFIGGSRGAFSTAVSGSGSVLNSMTPSSQVSQAGQSTQNAKGQQGNTGYMHDKLSGK
jgi:hypothetical protein